MPVAYVYGPLVSDLNDHAKWLLADYIRSEAAPALGFESKQMEVTFLPPVFSVGAQDLTVSVFWSTIWPQSPEDREMIEHKCNKCLNALRVLLIAPELEDILAASFEGSALVEVCPRPGCAFKTFLI